MEKTRRLTRRTPIAYATAAATFGALDAAWISQVALPLYKDGVPHLLADKLDPAPALVFYPLFLAGLNYFAIKPEQDLPLRKRLVDAALFGGVAYGTWGFTMKAVLQDVPWKVALADVAWGAAVSLAVAGAVHGALKLVERKN